MIYNSKLPTAAGGPFILNSNARHDEARVPRRPDDRPESRSTRTSSSSRTGRVTTSVTLNGSSSSTIVEGIIYVPGGQVKLNGNGGTLIVDQVIANTFDINGNGGTIKVLRDKGVDAVIVAAGLVD